MDDAFNLAPTPDVIEEEVERTNMEFPESGVRGSFCRIWFSLLRNYRQYITSQENSPEVFFEREAFIADTPANAHPFLELFLASQAFQVTECFCFLFLGYISRFFHKFCGMQKNLYLVEKYMVVSVQT